jgi:hypothetical protein
MPSAAYQAFKRNRVDVVRLIDSHGRLHSGTPGKKGLGHITRSGVVMLCASWELYAESLAVEGVKHLCAKCGSPDELPLVVQKELAKHVRESKHELKPLALANSGWCEVLTAHIQQICALLNTPKAGPLTDLFHTFLGLPKLSDAWTAGPKALNAFVGVRGDIAHRGRDASYVPLSRLREHLALIDELAKETDNAVRAHLKAVSPGHRQPWQIIA